MWAKAIREGSYASQFTRVIPVHQVRVPSPTGPCVFAKSCVSVPVGSTEAGTTTEPVKNFGTITPFGNTGTVTPGGAALAELPAPWPVASPRAWAVGPFAAAGTVAGACSWLYSSATRRLDAVHRRAVSDDERHGYAGVLPVPQGTGWIEFLLTHEVKRP